MAELKSIRTDMGKAAEGILAVYPGTDLKCRIAKANNPRVVIARQKLRRDLKLKRALEGDMSSPEAKAAMAPVVAEYILVGWENMTNDGVPVPYSKEKAIELLSDPALEDFYDWVLSIAGSADLFRADVDEEAKGNS